MRERKTKEEITLSHEIIGELFHEFRVEKFDESLEDLNIPTFNIAYDYMLIELIKSNYDHFWCCQIIKLYETCWEKSYMKEFLSHLKSIRYIFNCLVYEGASFKEIKTFLSRFSITLKQFPKKLYIQSFNDTLRSLFWCKCTNCFPRKP